MSLLFVLLLVLLQVVVIGFKPRMWLWSLVMVGFFALSYSWVGSAIATPLYLILALGIGLIIVLGNILPLRRKISQAIYVRAKKILPRISETEQLALNAGDPWWEKDLFQGRPDFHKLHSLQKFTLSPEEQDFLATETAQLCAMIDDWQITHHEKDLPVAVWDYLRTKGFFGLVIKKKYGGKGFSAAAHSEIVLKIATRSSSAAVTVMVPNSLGPGELLDHYGTPAQKNYYLPRLATGLEIPCFALTGPTAGSDATSIPDLGIVCRGEYQGKEVLGIRLENVDKRYITLAPIATLVGLAFKLSDPEGLLGGIGREGITCALLPHDHPGMEIGNRLLPLDQVFMNGTVRIHQAFIPMDWVIGGQEMSGEGWRMLVECLSIGRSISLPACGTANALLATLTTSAYARVREQFKLPLGNFEGVQEGLAIMGGLTYMMNATRKFTVAAVDSGVRPAVASAIAKYHLTENGRTVLNWAMDIHGGRGIIMGPKNYLARMYQGVPIAITVEGANIMTRNLMIFGQGAMRCHPHLKNTYDSLVVADGLKAFDHSIFAHFAYLAQNKIRAIFHAITAAKFASSYPSRFKRYYQQISRLSAAAAFISDAILILLSGNIKVKERLSARLGDILSYLYMASATLKYFKDNGERVADEVFVKWALEHCLFEAQQALVGALANSPIRWLGTMYRCILFPYGLPYAAPRDGTDTKIAHALLSNSTTRQDFCAAAYVNLNMDDLVGRMELAYQTVLAAAPVKAKITQALKEGKLVKKNSIKVKVATVDTPPLADYPHQALHLGIINEEELARLELAAKYATAVIQVDEFNAYELGPKNAHPSWQTR